MPKPGAAEPPSICPTARPACIRAPQRRRGKPASECRSARRGVFHTGGLDGKSILSAATRAIIRSRAKLATKRSRRPICRMASAISTSASYRRRPRAGPSGSMPPEQEIVTDPSGNLTLAFRLQLEIGAAEFGALAGREPGDCRCAAGPSYWAVQGYARTRRAGAPTAAPFGQGAGTHLAQADDARRIRKDAGRCQPSSRGFPGRDPPGRAQGNLRAIPGRRRALAFGDGRNLRSRDGPRAYGVLPTAT